MVADPLAIHNRLEGFRGEVKWPSLGVRRPGFVLFLALALFLVGFFFSVGVGRIGVLGASSLPVYQGDLVLSGSNVTIIEDDEFKINGSIIVEENATLVLRNALLNFTQNSNFEFGIRLENPSGGDPRLLVENATILGNDRKLKLEFYASSQGSLSMLSAPKLYLFSRDSAALTISDSSIYHLGCVDESVIEVSNSSWSSGELRGYSSCEVVNCTMDRLQALSSEKIDVVDSTVMHTLTIYASGANFSADRLLSGIYSTWSFLENCSVLVAPDGRATSLFLTDTRVNEWIIGVYSSSNVTVSNSHLRIANLGDTAQLRLENTTIKYCNVYDQAQALVHWLLDVHVVGSAGQDVASAEVEASCPEGTNGTDGMPAQSGVTGPDGWARLTLAEKLLNATGEYPAGIYTVRAAYGGHSETTTVNMTGNKRIQLGLTGLPVPESGSLILALLIAAILLVGRARYWGKKRHSPSRR